MKKIYQKTFSDENRYVYLWYEQVICPKCGKGMIQDKTCAEYHELKLKFQLPEFTCPKCGHNFAIKNLKECNSDLVAYDYVNYSTITKEVNGSTITKKSESIYFDREKQRFIVFISYVKKTPTRNGLITKPFFYKWIIDLKTHTSIFWSPIIKERKMINTTNHFGFANSSGGPIREATPTLWMKLLKYMCYEKGVGSMYKEFVKRLNWHVINTDKLYDNNTKVIKENVEKFGVKLIADMAYGLVNCLNRIPNTVVKYDQYRKTYECLLNPNEFYTTYFTNCFIKKSPHEIIDHQTYLKAMIKENKLPKSKAFWKAYLKDPNTIDKMMFFQSCGFKNKDNLLKLINSNGRELFISRYFGNKHNEKILNNMKTIFKKMLKASSETQVINRFCSISDSKKYEMQDMIYMYERLKSKKEECLELVDWTNTFMDIHDELSALLEKIKYENENIPYDESDYQLAEKIGNYSFDLAKDTHQLIEIGQKMGICVGTYRNRALKQYSKIIHVQKEDKYVGCIELSKDYKLRQAKAKHNNIMSGELAKALKVWLVKKKINDYENCLDFKYIDIAHMITFI